MKDVKEYTARKLGEQLLTSEIHLTDYLQDMENKGGEQNFCVECLAKHSLAISGLAQEGTQFFQGAPIFTNIYNTANDLYNALPDFNIDKAKRYYNELRELRKDLVAQHLILGVKLDNIKHLPDCPRGKCNG